MCHKKYDDLTDSSIGYYGNYLCDSPWPLVKSAIQAMADIESSPDFILWTGDNVPHTDDPEPDFSTIFQTLSNITAELRTTFHHSIPIIPVLGNHDAYPKDDYPANLNSFYEAYLTKGGWGAVLPSAAQDEFKQGGYFAYPVRSGAMVLVVNTNLYYAYNTLGRNLKDPCGQMAWLRKKFQEAQDGEYKVIIAAHAPPGYFERSAKVPFFNRTYNDAYVDLLNEFGEVIQAQIYGHEHTDSFRIFASAKDEVRSVAFLAPSVTPWFPSMVPGGTAINPSIRLYSYNVSTIIDYKQYHLNLTKTNSKDETQKRIEDGLSTDKGSPVWEEFYQARTKYNLESLDPDSIVQLYSRLIKDDKLFQEYYFLNSAGYDNGICDDQCKKGQICAIAHIKIDELDRCMDNVIKEDAVHKVKVTSLGVHNIGGFLEICGEYQPQFFFLIIAISISMAVFVSAILIIFKVKQINRYTKLKLSYSGMI
ncbi:acid sphingomyelinase-like phosphodiesterase 3b isoform X2 [Oratosquilla oratoria]